MVKPKDKGMSFLMPDGHKTFEGVGENDEEIIVIAKTKEVADQLAKQHFIDVEFTLTENVFKPV